MKTLGKRIKELRKQNNFTGDELGQKLNVSRSTISLWESGARRPTAEMLKTISQLFNVSVDYLLTGKEPASTKDGYYSDPETAEYAEYLRTRPEAKMLFSASKDISKEDMQKAVEYIEFLKSKYK